VTRAAVGALERWFLHAPLRFVAVGVALWIGWALAAAALASAFAVEREVVPVLGQRAPVREAVHVLVSAPLAENALLWAVFGAAHFCARQWSLAQADVLAAGLSTAAFALGHWPFKVLYGAETLAGGWLLSMCFLWGARHRATARGLALSVALHVAVNTCAFALFHGR
jgi:hypothetical protein